MHPLAQRMIEQLRQRNLLSAGDRVGVAVSGGIDSVSLLRLLLELRSEFGIVLSVVHFNHKLRSAESDADEQFVANLTAHYGLEFHVDRDDVARVAAAERVSVETAARNLRYGFFRHLLGEDREVSDLPEAQLDKVCTGHTLDDQAETVLMRMIRGSGLKGLGGIHPRITVEDSAEEPSGFIVRPLLGVRRRDLEAYLKEIGQVWREDATNTDTSFTRNRVRQLLIPVLESEFNRNVAENLSELAHIARDEEEYWQNEVAGWMGTVVHWSEPEWLRRGMAASSLVQIGSSNRTGASATSNEGLHEKIEHTPWLTMNASVSRLWFLAEPVAAQRRLLKSIGEHAGIPLEFRHVEEILRFAVEEGSGKELSLPLGWKLLRDPDQIVFVTPDLRDEIASPDYDYPLPVPGEVAVPEAGMRFETQIVPANGLAGYNPDHLLDADFVRGPLSVRNWRPGDRFWPAHTKSPKKIKELLQERHVGHAERRLWPVIVGTSNIVWLRGFPVPAEFKSKPGRDALSIREWPLAVGSVGDLHD